jgi:hypothetical protein
MKYAENNCKRSYITPLDLASRLQVLRLKWTAYDRFVIRWLNLFLLVVDLPNGNTAIQYFLSMRHSRIVLSYSSTHQCQIVVKYMSKRCQSYRMVRSTHLLPIFYRFLLVAACVGSNNTPLRVASGVNMNALSEIYISQSEIESTLQNNQSENRFFRVLILLYNLFCR